MRDAPTGFPVGVHINDVVHSQKATSCAKYIAYDEVPCDSARFSASLRQKRIT
jgi:hypothetical protein